MCSSFLSEIHSPTPRRAAALLSPSPAVAACLSLACCTFRGCASTPTYREGDLIHSLFAREQEIACLYSLEHALLQNMYRNFHIFPSFLHEHYPKKSDIRPYKRRQQTGKRQKQLAIITPTVSLGRRRRRATVVSAGIAGSGDSYLQSVRRAVGRQSA